MKGEIITDRINVPAAKGVCFTVKCGQIIKVIDVCGKQVGDFIAFNLNDLKEKFSTGRTRVENGTLRVTTGNKLYSQRLNVMFSVVSDTCGIHDLLYPPCCRWVFKNRYKVDPKDGCLENLETCLAEWGIYKDDIPDPFNLFMRSEIINGQKLRILEPVSKAGDYIELQAEMDCLVAISSCACDSGPVNAGKLKPLEIVIM